MYSPSNNSLGEMYYQTNCNIMRLVVRKRPIVLSYYAGKLLSHRVFLLCKRDTLSLRCSIYHKESYFKRKSISFKVSCYKYVV